MALLRSQGPLRRALARIAGRVVERRVWERLGFARASDYARERVGLAGRTLHDLARTDAALAKLPGVEAALAESRIGWTSARLLARAATAESEARWLAFAARATTRALEREVRRVDRGALEAGAVLAGTGDGGADPERQADGTEILAGIVIGCTPIVRAKWSRVRQHAPRVAGERCAPWQCLEAAMAEVLSSIRLDELPEAPFAPTLAAPLAAPFAAPVAPPFAVHMAAPVAARGAVPTAPPRLTGECEAANACPRHSALAAVAPREPSAPAPGAPTNPAIQALVHGLEAADAFELDARLRGAVALEQRCEVEVAPLLARVVQAKAYRRLGYENAETWADARLGISPRKVRALLRLERAGAAAPELRTAFREGRLSWVQAHALIPLLSLREARPFRRAWVERAPQVSVRRLEEDLDRALLLRETDPARFTLAGGLPEEMGSAGPAAVASGSAAPAAFEAGDAADGRQTRARESHPGGSPPALESARFFLSAPRDVACLFQATLCTVRRLLERRTGRPATPGDAAEAIFDHALEGWSALQPRVRREHRVFERDGWRCTVPGCGSYRNLHDHHVEFRSAGGGDELSNRTTLCAWHHLRGVHAGRVRCRGAAPGGLRFELGIRADGSALLRYAPGEVICR